MKKDWTTEYDAWDSRLRPAACNRSAVCYPTGTMAPCPPPGKKKRGGATGAAGRPAKRARPSTNDPPQTVSLLKPFQHANDQEDRDDAQFVAYLDSRPAEAVAFDPARLIPEEGGTEEDDVRDLFGSHVRELDALKETDPEFYAFLLQNDKELLEFGQQQLEQERETAGVPVSQSSDKAGDAHTPGQTLLTPEEFARIADGVRESPSYRRVATLLNAYRACVRSMVTGAAMTVETATRAEVEGPHRKKKFKEAVKGKPVDVSAPAPATKETLSTDGLMFRVHMDAEDAGSLIHDVVTATLDAVANAFASTLGNPDKAGLKPRSVSLANSFWLDTVLLLEYFYGKAKTPQQQTLHVRCASYTVCHGFLSGDIDAFGFGFRPSMDRYCASSAPKSLRKSRSPSMARGTTHAKGRDGCPSPSLLHYSEPGWPPWSAELPSADQATCAVPTTGCDVGV